MAFRSKMIKNVFLLIFTLVYTIKCESSLYKSDIMYNTINEATKFFGNIKTKYESQQLNQNTLKKLEDELVLYQNESKAKVYRMKRNIHDIEQNEDVNVLKEFQDVSISVLTDIQDITMFSFSNGSKFAAILNSTAVLFYHLKEDTFDCIETYPLINGTRVLINNYISDTLAMIQTYYGIAILRSRQNIILQNMYMAQYLENPESSPVKYITTWQGMNQLYLGIASRSNVYIYVWLGEHFDLVDNLGYGAEKLISFQNNGFIYLITTGFPTILWRFSLHLNKFVVRQTFSFSYDSTAFSYAREHSAEHFLAISGPTSTILFKEMYNRFIPFQKISAASQIHYLIINNTILLLCLQRNTLKLYQYDGWRFVQSGIEILNVKRITVIDSFSENQLIIQYENNTWELKNPIWVQKKSWYHLRSDIKSWCLGAIDMKQMVSSEVPFKNNTIHILKGHINQLNVHNINNGGATELRKLSNRYWNLTLRLEKERNSVNHLQFAENSIFKEMRMKKVEASCKSKCSVNRMLTRLNETLFNKFRKSRDKDQMLTFNNIKLKEADNILCPVLGLEVKELFVNREINGISLFNLEKESLRTTGNQIITGLHSFVNLKVITAHIPLQTAAQSVMQQIYVKHIEVKELNVTGGGFLLLSNGSLTVMNELITGSTVKIVGFVNIKGKLNGTGFDRIKPFIEILKPLTLPKSCILYNVHVTHLLNTNDFSRNTGVTLREILYNGLQFHHNVKGHLTISMSDLIWTNTTLVQYKNWVTSHSVDTVLVSGTKYVPHNITSMASVYDNFPIPRLKNELCAPAALMPEIQSFEIFIENLFAQNLKGIHAFESGKLSNIVLNSATSIKTVNLSLKQFIKNVVIQNGLILKILKTDLADLKQLISGWTKFNTFEGPIRVTNLAVDTIQASSLLNMSSYKAIKALTTKKNIHIELMNNVNITAFMTNVVHTEDMLSLGRINFKNDFAANKIHAIHTSGNVTILPISNLGSKNITTNLKTHNINVPHIFNYMEDNILSVYILQGCITQIHEPAVGVVNDIKLSKVFEEIWIGNNITLLTNKNLQFRNMILNGKATFSEYIHGLTFGTWLDIRDILLSKTRLQTIRSPSHFQQIHALCINGSTTSILNSSSTLLQDLFFNSLVKYSMQVVNSTLHFHTLRAIADVDVRDMINNMNLRSDLVRYDSEKNIITGKKTVMHLTAKDLIGLDFKQWKERAVMVKRLDLIIVKGHKVFNRLYINKLNLFGSIISRRIEDLFLKSSAQNISSLEKIGGSVNVLSVTLDGQINDTNLTNVVNYQLKQHKSRQNIKSFLTLQDNLNIVGNLTVKGFYKNVELQSFYKESVNLKSAFDKMNQIGDFIEAINVALRNRAVYVSKFESVDDNITVFSLDTDEKRIFNQCVIQNVSVICNGTAIANTMETIKINDVIMIKYLTIQNSPFLVLVKPNNIIIYKVYGLQKQLRPITELNIPNILEASAESILNTFWIVLRLPHKMLIIYYKPRGNIQRYTLAASNILATSIVPNDQMLILRSDGIWLLDGLAKPKCISSINLNGHIDSFILDTKYYIKVTGNESASFLKARYIGN